MELMNRANISDFDMYLYLQHHYYEHLDEELYEKELADWYFLRTGRGPDAIRHPRTFNDKIQWLKLYDNTDLKALCSDKLAVRDYLRDLAVEGLHLIPLLGVWKDASDIDFSSLPEAFVLKQNAACKLNLIIKNRSKMDEKATRKQMAKWLETQYGFNGMECQYLKIPRRIIAEQYIQEIDGNLYDYKVFCFNGRPEYIEVIGDRLSSDSHGRSAFYDLDWKQQEFHTMTYPVFERAPEKPENLEVMIEIARKLSSPFPFVRIDLYNIGGKIYFGEFTFTPTNGFAHWYPEDANEMLGSMICLPEKGKQADE